MSKPRVGYSWWGYMTDVRYKNGQKHSSPDGSLLHAFSIIRGLQNKGFDVCRLMPDRDAYHFSIKGRHAFDDFSTNERFEAYATIKPYTNIHLPEEIIFDWPDVDFVIHEWRMPTRYNTLPMNHPEFEPDMVLQNALIQHYTEKRVPIILLDLDYMFDPINDNQFHWVFEPGYKRGPDHHIYIPFLLKEMYQFPMQVPEKKIVYVGNRYYRDEEFEKCFQKPDKVIDYEVWGNWLEHGKDSAERWPHINFKGRAQPYQMHEALEKAVLTPLLQRKDYIENGFMSIRLIESLLYGTIPVLMTKEFNSPDVYLPDQLIVDSNTELVKLAKKATLYKTDFREKLRRSIIETESFQKHDVSNFVDTILNVL